jgi:hypothetical protein
MKKIVYRSLIILISFLIILVIFLSTIGIKTDKFNSEISKQIKKINPNLEIKLSQVSATLSPFKFEVNAKTIGTKITYKDKNIELESIKSNISLKSFLNNKFALTEISISSKSLLINDLINFIRLLNNDPKFFIAEQFIKKGYIVADLKLEFDELGKIKNNYKINGLVRDAQISLLSKKKLSNIDFIFEISDKKLKLNDINLLVYKKNIFASEIVALKQVNEFLVTGKFNNKNLKFKEQDINYFIDLGIFKKNIKEIIFSSDSDFRFKINQKFKLNDLYIKSNINLNYLKIDNFLELKKNFPNIKDDIIFENQKIKFEYKKNNINIIGFGDVFLQDELDIISYNIKKDNKDFFFDIDLKISKNPFLINILNYEKNEKTNLDLVLKGKSNKDEIFIKEFSLFENDNTLSIKDLQLTNNYKLDNIGNIQIDYIDKENFDNKINIIKDNKDYKIVGDSFNINNLITELLASKNSKKLNFFNKKYKVIFDIKKIYLDKNNISNNLKGFLILNNNEISKLNLESEFSTKEKIKFTINTNDNDEKVTTLFSNKAKPLVDRYKFIKGFNEGILDFNSIKKNSTSKSTLKIYDFKLKELPALTKILTLASLQGIADLLSGEGIRFNEFEMSFTNNGSLMTIDEIYAIGPAISILLEGYIERDNLVSLRGTLVPATTINKTISSIPLLGDILVGKKTGEGIFGVSFKIKGPPKDLETSVNPIKTLTPRFITRTLEKIKKN